MKQFLLFLFCVCFLPGLKALDSIVTHAYGGDLSTYILLSRKTEVLIDSNGVYSIEQILADSSLDFKPRRDYSVPLLPFVVWNRIRLTNTGDQSRHDFFTAYIYSDSTWMYVVEEGRVVEEWLSGSQLRPSEKYTQDASTYLPFSLAPGETKDFYFKVKFVTETSYISRGISLLSIYPGSPYMQANAKTLRNQFFYTGMLAAIALASFLMVFVFKEAMFFSFGCLMLFFAVYFLGHYSHLSSLLDISTSTTQARIQVFLLGGALISLYSFLFNYLSIPQKIPKYGPWFRRFSLLLLGLPVFLILVFNVHHLVQNVLLLIWIILVFVMIIYLVWQGERTAKIVLASISVLALSGLISVLYSIDLLPPSFRLYNENAFQIGVFLFSGVLFYGLFDRVNLIRKEKAAAEKLSELKSNFFANISHEFRTPLTLMMGPLQQVLESTQDAGDQALLNLAYTNANRQLSLVNQLLDLSKAEEGVLRLRAAEKDFLPFIKGAVFTYASLAEQKGVALYFATEEEHIPLFFDQQKMEQVIYNLISNAFNFTDEGGRVAVTVSVKRGKLEVEIADTGLGIAKNKLPYIFDRFFRGDAEGDASRPGYGIGLSLAKELVQLHHGRIAISSEVGLGTKVTLFFQLGKTHLSKAEIVGNVPGFIEKQPAPTTKEFTPVLTPETDTKAYPEILLIEDNEDVRLFIKQGLVHSFRIMEASNGIEGCKMARENMPDLIISDVMMPKMNGYQVCQTLKTDVRTSHIPIILLTAKAAHQAKLTGLETGADDYLTKPFDAKELEIRVNNLIHFRKLLRQRFATDLSIKPSELVTSSVDEAFLCKALEIIEGNLSNEEFGVERLAVEIGMSRPSLNRKLRAIVDKSTNQFIQSIRLQSARELLNQQSGSVAEIAFQTGFRSTAYFVKCFKDQYGQTPGAFTKKDEV